MLYKRQYISLVVLLRYRGRMRGRASLLDRHAGWDAKEAKRCVSDGLSHSARKRGTLCKIFFERKICPKFQVEFGAFLC